MLDSFRQKEVIMFLSDLVDEFLLDCKVRALSELTVNNYRKQLKKFLLYLETTHSVTELEQIRPALVKRYISFLQECCSGYPYSTEASAVDSSF